MKHFPTKDITLAGDILGAMEEARANLRTPLARYRKVMEHPATAVLCSQFMSMERAKDERGVSRDLHKRFVRAVPTKGPNREFDFQAAERGRETSKRIEQFCAQLRAKMLREDEAFLAEDNRLARREYSGRAPNKRSWMET